MTNFTVMNLNKGDALLQNRIVQINNIISKYRPDIFSINELNLEKYDDTTPKQFPQYKLECDDLRKTDLMARTGLLIHTNTKYSRRRDLETRGAAVVWIQISQRGKKIVLIQSIYRQFQMLSKPGTGTPQQQYQRWKSIVDKWSQASKEKKEIITLGNLNLNYLAWDLNPPQMAANDRSQLKMVDYLKAQIMTQGHSVTNTKPTRNVGSLTERETCIYFIITNRIDLRNNHENIYPTFSDHSLLIYRKKEKTSKNVRHFIRTRKMKIFDINKYKRDILEHGLYLQTLYEGDTHRIAENTIKIIQDTLDNQAPVQRILITNQARPKLSQEARELLVMRDQAHKDYLRTKDPGHQRNMKHLRNQANRVIGKENYTNKVKNLQQPGLSTKEKWNRIKQETGQQNFETPHLIIEGTRHHTAPKEIASALNRQYIRGIKKIIAELPPPPQRTP